MIQILHGDSLELLKSIPSNSIDSLVTDPPAGIAFLNQKWDTDKGGRDAWIAWLQSIMVEVFRVLKPGAHGLVWALPRTSHWTAMALENVGFEIRDCITHIFGQGFPKSLDVSKAIDRMRGLKREIVGEQTLTGNAGLSTKEKGGTYGVDVGTAGSVKIPITKAASPEAEYYEGWGSALKPGSEHWWLIRKPFRGSIAKNMLANATGAINVDACRVGNGHVTINAFDHGAKPFGGAAGEAYTSRESSGRWPSNVIFSHSPDCQKVGKKKVKGANDPRRADGSLNSGGLFGAGVAAAPAARVYADSESKETVDDWRCVEGCPVRELDAQSGERVSGAMRPGQIIACESGFGVNSKSMSAQGHEASVGGASRFFNIFEPDTDQSFLYAAKCAMSEKNEGLSSKKRKVNDGRKTEINNPYQRGETERRNTHPTVKSQALMRWLCRLVAPAGGTVLDCFAGSGSTLLAAHAEEFDAIGIERESEFVEIIRARVKHATKQQRLFDAVGGAK